ncbi:MAG TPA: HupE/UreJ family protein [Steroidobacteraceae bacterium]|nr:HupE/UreJ family protein [Steroidobacteraceae bacterium]
MSRFALRPILPVAVLLLASPAAWAHPGEGSHAGHLVAGMLHPLTGLDHVLMIVAVSAWSALLPLKGRLTVAACLALFVGIGALLPVSGGPVLESAIALTVIGSGLLLAVGRRAPLWASGALAAGFALIHGFAHGAEGPAHAGLYVPGLVVSTALLAALVSHAAARLSAHATFLRIAGAASAAAGAAALTA